MPGKTKQAPDFISMACTSASVSYREVLTPNELEKALASGEVPRNRLPHLVTLFEEAPDALLRGLVEQMSKTLDRARIEENIFRIAEEVQVRDRIRSLFNR